MRYAMIMAGGSGTRLWPMSRAHQPKQLIRFIHGPEGTAPRSLLEVAASRLEGIVPPERRFICTGERYRDEIRATLPAFGDAQILGEPEGRDTLNAVGFAAAVFAKADPDAVFAVLTADHLIEPDDVFARAMDVGFRLVEADAKRLVTFGIRPSYPATGFGYIEQGHALTLPGSADGGLAFRVQRFVEKPPLPKAQAYFESGQFFWNAGMFVFSARTVLSLIEKYKPATAEGLKKIAEAWDTPRQEAVLREVYPTLEKISVDYGMMEPASRDTAVTIAGVRMDVRWLDVGSWPSYGETLPADKTGNRSAGCGLVSHEAGDNIVVGAGEGHTVALLGCKGLIVIHTPEATLVMPRDRAQDLKSLHSKVDERLR